MTKTYTVYFEGEIEVEAENEEDAKFQASMFLDGDFVITSVEETEDE